MKYEKANAETITFDFPMMMSGSGDFPAGVDGCPNGYSANSDGSITCPWVDWDDWSDVEWDEDYSCNFVYRPR